MRRFIRTATPALAEASLKGYGAGGPDPEADAALGRRLRALHDLPADTLGYQYVEFYVRNGIELPGEGDDRPNLFVGHDMCHVIAGYEPTGQGEIALGAMQLAMTDSDAHWIAMLANLAVHEAGFLATAPVVAKTGTLARPGAVELLADAFRRGAAVHGRLHHRRPPRPGRAADRRGARARSGCRRSTPPSASAERRDDREPFSRRGARRRGPARSAR